MRVRTRWPFVCLLAILAAIVPAAACADSNLLVTNPDFDDGLAGWTMGVSQASNIADDSDDCPGSFSFTGSSTGPVSPSQVRIVSPDCIPVQPGDSLELEVTYRAEAPVHLEALPFGGANCSSSFIAELGPALPPMGDWTVARRSIVVGPANVTGVRFAVIALFDPGPVSFMLDLDRAYLGSAERIFADDFEATSICRWSNAN